jgi:hypothetical protein
MANTFTNKLISETSPYLLQHAHNPVDWYPWGDEVLQIAREKNKPILISIGYAACHWCHVMEKESFEDEATAVIMNENFINVKIDREERPDLDHIYMDAVQAMTGSGGWPLNVFLTPEGKPFYGGTYFPPKRAFNRPSWQEVLNNVSQAFREKRNEIDAQAENLTEHLIQSNSFGQQKISNSEKIFKKEKLDEAFDHIMKSADMEWGGFGKAPKFPQTFTIQFLLRYHHITKNDRALTQALLSLDKMIEGGIYDQLGGGFARYSTDTEWLAPHFEKMLYDNALLISVLSEAYQVSKKERYKEVIEETIEFVKRELLHPGGGFYSALDADSEGVEGKFYVWEYEEVKKLLAENFDIFCEYYDITSHGNWHDAISSEEKKNILRVKEPFEKFAEREKVKAAALKKILGDGKQTLLKERNKKIRPALDDKIILGWNALMNTACCKAFAATGNEQFRQLAIRNMEFLLNKFNAANDDEFYHTWKNDTAKYPAFLDDYAFLIQALIHLQEITANGEWLIRAKKITQFVINNFSEETGFFFFTKKDQPNVIVRKKEIYDGAIPSGNSIMAYNLYHLSFLFDKKEWKQRSIDIISSVDRPIISYPTSFGIWACLFQEIISGTSEIALTGKNFTNLHLELLQYYIPHRVLMASDIKKPDFPLLADKPIMKVATIWLCRDFACSSPVNTLKDLRILIDRPDQG